ncbi:DUF1285 domain-containing protein [Halomonas halocynthiae]|uniref:DUF1285 domain-containing protein n=1 Tax=Halomonas halocynthiae TaxID=176290 RepID=UPI00040B49BF|nr:DUF1285 domain-containing protein [Halomonas halocynthiae]
MNLDTMVAGIGPAGKIPPVDSWAPSQGGDMDLLITLDGQWIHEGRAIERAALVRLLARILRREDDGHYYLVTPQEKQRIRVEDHPFIIVDADKGIDGQSGQDWWLTTQYGDRIRLGDEHRLCVTEMPNGDPVPEVAVRFGMSARLGRNVFYRLVEQAEPIKDPLIQHQHQHQHQWQWVLASGGINHPLGYLDEAP